MPFWAKVSRKSKNYKTITSNRLGALNSHDVQKHRQGSHLSPESSKMKCFTKSSLEEFQTHFLSFWPSKPPKARFWVQTSRESKNYKTITSDFLGALNSNDVQKHRQGSHLSPESSKMKCFTKSSLEQFQRLVSSFWPNEAPKASFWIQIRGKSENYKTI